MKKIQISPTNYIRIRQLVESKVLPTNHSKLFKREQQGKECPGDLTLQFNMNSFAKPHESINIVKQKTRLPTTAIKQQTVISRKGNNIFKKIRISKEIKNTGILSLLKNLGKSGALEHKNGGEPIRNFKNIIEQKRMSQKPEVNTRIKVKRQSTPGKRLGANLQSIPKGNLIQNMSKRVIDKKLLEGIPIRTRNQNFLAPTDSEIAMKVKTTKEKAMFGLPQRFETDKRHFLEDRRNSVAPGVNNLRQITQVRKPNVFGGNQEIIKCKANKYIFSSVAQSG